MVDKWKEGELCYVVFPVRNMIIPYLVLTTPTLSQGVLVMSVIITKAGASDEHGYNTRPYTGKWVSLEYCFKTYIEALEHLCEIIEQRAHTLESKANHNRHVLSVLKDRLKKEKKRKLTEITNV